MKQVIIDGVDTVAYELKRINKEIQSKALIAITAGAKVLETRAKEIAPVRTGALRDSISITNRYIGKFIRLEIGPHVIYDAVVEFTRRAYLRPALHEKKHEILATIKTTYLALIEKF